ncbi:hypothetical protein OG949_33075 [Streptomyces scopuliridis]|uniref:hypothetical protein n=1 Tax=Streptomyces scopuliridis TaxID=452529 RepID=UPI002DD80008|nr:hypothetical protein [Streptomyces scopuliridis]WSB37202.1 hypothetical protein OG949_33075 [Streptomyces scopuliridis]
MTDLVLKELRLRHATLDLKAERLRCEWRTVPATGPRAAALGKRVKSVQGQADDYAAIIEAAGEL